jgi:membrane complex biogenesis BtpA family protein
MKGWLDETFHVQKPIIGMVHVPALPGTPLSQRDTAIGALVDTVRADVEALQSGGVDGLLFCNEHDRPYTLSVGPEVPAAMTRLVTAVLTDVRVPFGTDILWDSRAALAVARATDAAFVRGVLTGAYAGDFGLWDTSAGAILRYREAIGAGRVRLFFNINAEFASPVAPRPMEQVARSVAISAMADVLCVSGSMTGTEVAEDMLERVRRAVPEVALLANTGVTAANVAKKLAIADGAIVGTSLKVDGVTWNAVDRRRVADLMGIVRSLR